jgi:hypothetical protein
MTAAIAAAIVLAEPLVGTAEARFRTYTTCYVFAPFPREDRVCAIGNGFGAVLAARRGQRVVRYLVCVRGRGGQVHYCRRKRSRPYGARPSRLRMYRRVRRPGRYTVRWRRRGHLIDKDRLRVRIGD